jgi:hypothetical protein
MLEGSDERVLSELSANLLRERTFAYTDYNPKQVFLVQTSNPQELSATVDTDDYRGKDNAT